MPEYTFLFQPRFNPVAFWTQRLKHVFAESELANLPPRENVIHMGCLVNLLIY
jgi:hypothetical protein